MQAFFFYLFFGNKDKAYCDKNKPFWNQTAQVQVSATAEYGQLSQLPSAMSLQFFPQGSIWVNTILPENEYSKQPGKHTGSMFRSK